MQSFPMFIHTTGRRIVIAGGGEQAAQKARLMVKTDAQIVLAAPELDDELHALVTSGRASWHATGITPQTFDGAVMGFIATGSPRRNAELHALAKSVRCPVNVVDHPALCDLTTPSIVDRDPVVVAIGTGGTAPVLARQIKTRIEQELPANLGGLSALAGRLRRSAATHVAWPQRVAFWTWVFSGTPRALWSRGAEREAASTIKAAIQAGCAPGDTSLGSIALVGAGPGARDLLTLRAVQRLQEADVIYYDRLVDPQVLELARRDARRVFVGKHVGAQDWPQDRINALIVAEAGKGLNVVRLKSGDPAIFGRAGEELSAARDTGIAVEIVPGVTAASAAAAALGQSLTERGVANTLILTTGTSRAGDDLPDTTRFSGPGSTTAFYMSARQTPRIQRDLLARGLPDSSPVQIVVDASKPTQKLLHGALRDLSSLVEQNGVTGGAMVLVTWPFGVENAVTPALVANSVAAG